jgi:hypothetical protein
MFRFGARATPAAAFAQGARSVLYMGAWCTRRHFARMRSPLVFGHLDPRMFLSSANGLATFGPDSALASAGDNALATCAAPNSELMASIAMMESLLAAASYTPNWSIRCTFTDWQKTHSAYKMSARDVRCV